MTRVRDEESTGRREELYAGASFDCEFCRRPEDCNLPAVDEDGHTPLAPSAIVDIYNNRRYRHYLTDFSTAEPLRDHLRERALYWTQGRPPAERDAAMGTVASCVEWWQIAHPAHAEARRAIARIEDRQLEAEVRRFAPLAPKEKFALIRREMAAVGEKVDLNRVLRSETTPCHDVKQVHAYLMAGDTGENFWEGTGL